MKYFSEPINYFTATAAVLFLGSLFAFGRHFDVHFHDTYYVIPLKQYLILLAFCLLAIWTIYKLADNFFYSARLTTIHVAFTIITIASLAVIPMLLTQLYLPGERVALKANAKEWSAWQNYTATYSWTLLAFLLTQSLLIIHLLIGIIKRLKN